MLYRSGNNLENGAIQFIEKNDTITVFSAYLKLETLKSLNLNKKIKQIVVRWEIEDLCKKISDLELYYYCLEHNITLYRNTRIHLKAFWNNGNEVFFGSANITGRGIGEKGAFNYELNGNINKLSYDDIGYFNEILMHSEYVSPALFKKIKTKVENTELPTIKFPVIKTKKSDSDYFLISNLPMSASVDELYKAYCNPEKLNIDEINYTTHDIALYDIPKKLNKISFYNYIKETFNAHPFILKLKDYIKNSPRQSLNYGSVVRWIQENTTTVPIPRSWEIKEKVIVNILYSWICDLDEGFIWDRPNHSQVIYYNKK